MPYTALPDRRMPYDIDGTLVYAGTDIGGAANALDSTQRGELNDDDQVTAIDVGPGNTTHRLFLFFPEQREVSGFWMQWHPGAGPAAFVNVTGSNDTANGIDGTWETASLPSGGPDGLSASVPFDRWRSGIKPISFTGPKKNVRFAVGPLASSSLRWNVLHVYGEAAGGQMAHDLVFIDQDNGGGPVEYPAAEDFGDQPLGTTVVRQFRVKNTSATETATNVNIQCNDADFAISEDNINWVVTINIASLGPGVESSTLYVRCTTPAPGAALKPRFARIVATCDAGFFG